MKYILSFVFFAFALIPFSVLGATSPGTLTVTAELPKNTILYEGASTTVSYKIIDSAYKKGQKSMYRIAIGFGEYAGERRDGVVEIPSTKMSSNGIKGTVLIQIPHDLTTRRYVDASVLPETSDVFMFAHVSKSLAGELEVKNEYKSPSILVYRSDDSALDVSKNDYYPAEDTTFSLFLKKSSMFDWWGGRFEFMVQSMNARSAKLGLYMDNKKVGEITLKKGKKVNLSITTPVSAGMTGTLNGVLTYEKMITAGLGKFTMVQGPLTEDSSRRLKNSDSLPAQGWATLIAKPTGTPFQVRFTGSYNLLKGCDSVLSHVLEYGDGEKYTLGSSLCGTKGDYDFKHTYAPGTYGSYIALHRPYRGNWMYFQQASALITVSASGEVTIKVTDPFSGKKG